VLTTINGVQITMDRQGRYVERFIKGERPGTFVEHTCTFALVGVKPTMPSMSLDEFQAQQVQDLHEFEHVQRASKDHRYSKESRYFQFVVEDLACPKTNEQVAEFWTEMDHGSTRKKKRHYVRHTVVSVDGLRNETARIERKYQRLRNKHGAV